MEPELFKHIVEIMNENVPEDTEKKAAELKENGIKTKRYSSHIYVVKNFQSP